MKQDALKYVPVDEIMESPEALRTVDEEKVEFSEMVESVKRQGVLNPISIRPMPNGKFSLIDGLHRFTAAKRAGLTEIPCKIMDIDEAKTLEVQVVANLMKVDTRPVEYAKHLTRMLSYNPLMTLSELAGKINKSTSWLDQRFGLLKLPDTIKEMVDGGSIGLSNAFMLSKLPAEEMGNYLDRAQTMQPTEFGPLVKSRCKEIQEAKRQGKDVAEETFVPVAHLRKTSEIKDEMDNSKVADQLVRDCRISTAVDGFKLGIKWVLNMDPTSIQAAQAAYEARKTQVNQAKERRAAERAEKKAKEAAEKSAAAQAELEKVKATANTVV
jgi:ParB/RepB/Spo0J family partition protein